MRKRILFILSILFFLLFAIQFNTNIEAHSYLADKAETPVKLNNTGARSICQTYDGYVWIGQFAGLNRYDSKELVAFNSYTDDNGEVVNIENVRLLSHYQSKLYLVCTVGLLMFENNKFTKIDLGDDVYIYDIIINDAGLLYISTSSGLYTYDSLTNEKKADSKHIESILAVMPYKNTIYILKDSKVYDYDNNCIYESVADPAYTIYSFEDKLAIATNSGKIFFYNLTSNELLSKSIKLKDVSGNSGDMVHKFVYSKDDKTLFAAAEKGLYSIDEKTLEASYAKKLENNSKLVDIMIDYEKNLWIASYISGVSIISQSSLVDILFDIDTKTIPVDDRLVYAVLKYGNDLYIATGSGIYVYDVVNEVLKTDHPLITQINAILAIDATKEETADKDIPYYDVRDIEVFKNKIYFATCGSGLFEYNPETEAFRIYSGLDINPDDPDVKTTGYYAVAQRCLKAYDDYLYIGTTTSSIVRFDGTNFIYNREIPIAPKGQILYIDRSAFGKITFVASGSGIYTINDDLETSSCHLIHGVEELTSGILKFYQDGDNFFYNIYGRFFVINTRNGNYSDPKEIKIPFVNSSITEINKVEIRDNIGNTSYKYVIASEKQIYIIDDLLADELVYDFYDSSNGLKSSIKGNSSGYYDEENMIYYFQSQEGVFTYDFTQTEEARVPLKVAVNSVNADGNSYFGNDVTVSKNAERVTFNFAAFSFKPTKGYKVYYKLDGADKDYVEADGAVSSVSYTNLKGGKYKFHIYVVDELGQESNHIEVNLTKTMHLYEYPAFWAVIIILGVAIIIALNVYFIKYRMAKIIERENEYKEITLEAIEAIARTIDAKDAYTNGHSKRVGIYSREIARALELSEQEIENIYYIALLHDIGKIAIPENILNKPGRLTDEEFEIMKSHTTAGAKILEGISTIPDIVAGAKYHHEKYGGGGYPTGIKGEEIPFIARIICCADCYDAMATKRVYKEPYTKEKIISEFERCKEIQFDPHIADIVIKLIKEDRLRYGTEEKKNYKKAEIIDAKAEEIKKEE
ncbi:MAG: HD domain-containing protein [Acholeplasmatales bacterium]|nr:HD domain-containing protein [Acholeplasmatales bacterium]